ncbi:dynactin subunit 3-like isoform X2 [Actinia tenebrosa]|uniref:Dynactin subunit 3-like isoform X1 n=1 Tax=Actinia tenebrosa TaxID=6105 RepID=A0A6P8H9J6_ACTTE|nr:dynactin subunit 3-like isoform X1 [Actinia tenebrosa]XP_031549146.1 dynactin subunit 3-like isoform X2 [Actinia tenebrosa]
MADEKGEVLTILERRIDELESKVLSNEEDLKKFQNESCLDTLVRVQNELQRLPTKYYRISETWKKIKELENYLSTEFLERVALSDDVKADIIMAGENQLQSCCEKLHEIEDLKKIVSTEPLKDLPTLSSKMQPLIEVQINHQEETEHTSSQLNKLLSHYNNIVSMLSKQFIEWDNILTRMEVDLDTKPLE